MQRSSVADYFGNFMSFPPPPPSLHDRVKYLFIAQHWMRGGGGEEQVSEIEQGFIWLKNLLYPNKCVHLDLYPFVINDVNQGDQLLRRWKEQDKPSNFKGGTSLRLYLR